jgi:hypothetical protein
MLLGTGIAALDLQHLYSVLCIHFPILSSVRLHCFLATVNYSQENE